jgi:hypothetical protein
VKARFLALTLVLVGGCDKQLPTAPTAAKAPLEAKMQDWVQTSRVNPNDLDDSVLEGLTLEHDIWREDVNLCRTKAREYCHPSGSECAWTVDYYTVLRPDVCPLEPID